MSKRKAVRFEEGAGNAKKAKFTHDSDADSDTKSGTSEEQHPLKRSNTLGRLDTVDSSNSSSDNANKSTHNHESQSSVASAMDAMDIDASSSSDGKRSPVKMEISSHNGSPPLRPTAESSSKQAKIAPAAAAAATAGGKPKEGPKMRVSADGMSVIIEDPVTRWPPLVIRTAIETGACGLFRRPGGARIQVTSDPSTWTSHFCHEKLPSGKQCLHQMRTKKGDDGKYQCTGPLKHKSEKQVARVAPGGFAFYDVNDPLKATYTCTRMHSCLATKLFADVYKGRILEVMESESSAIAALNEAIKSRPIECAINVWNRDNGEPIVNLYDADV